MLAPVLAGGSVAAGQSAADTVVPAMWTVEGKVQVGRRRGPEPVAGAWVVVHRISSDSLGRVSGGALDSARTTASGSYRIRYRHFGESRATYIAITTYSGISYITSPLTQPRVTGDDGIIMVFDTTRPPFPVRAAGRHFVITAPDDDDRRRIIEVYELSNDSTLTVIGTEANPVWRAPLPPGVEDLQLNPDGDITAGTAKRIGDWLNVFAPFSPGLRQLSFSYSLPASAFPLSLPMVDSVTVLELLAEESGAVIDGADLVEVAPVVQEGQRLRRFLARDVKSSSVVRLTMPRSVSRAVKQSVSIITVVIAAIMGAVLAFAFWRRARSRSATPAVVDPVETLVRELAMMDADLERGAIASDVERADFDAKRLALKSRLTAALAARERAS